LPKVHWLEEKNNVGAKVMNVQRTGKNWNSIWLILPALVATLSLYWLYNAFAQPQVPYMDTMLYITQVEKIIRGETTWLSLYGSGEHRGLIFPFVLMVEWIFWGVDSRITTLLTGCVVAATFFFWLRSLVLARYDIFGESYPASKTLALSIVAAVIIVSPAGFELWTLDLGFAQLIKNFLIVLFFYQLSISRPWAKNCVWAVSFGIWGGFLILFATYGWSYPFLAAVTFALICVFVSEPQIRINTIAVLMPMFFAQYLYVNLGQGVFSNSEHASQGVFFLELIKGMFYGAGTSFIGGEAIAKSGVPVIVVLLCGGLLLLCAGMALMKVLITPTPVRVFAAALLVFSLTVLAGVTLARGATNYLNTGASRYFVDYVWLLLAPVLILSKSTDKLASSSSAAWLSHLPLQKIYDAARFIMLVLLSVALLGHLRTWHVELNTAPYRAEIFNAMAKVYREGVKAEADAKILQSPYEVARSGIDIAQRYNLATLRTYGSSCDLRSAIYAGDWYPAGQDGSRWMGKQAEITVSKCTGPVVIKVYIPEHFPARELKIKYDNQIRSLYLQPGVTVVETLENSANKRIDIQLNLNGTTNLLTQGVSTDGRDLGMLLTFIGTDSVQ
jgi:hypothetical protein